MIEASNLDLAIADADSVAADADRGQPIAIDDEGEIDEARPTHLVALLDEIAVLGRRRFVEAMHDGSKPDRG